MKHLQNIWSSLILPSASLKTHNKIAIISNFIIGILAFSAQLYFFTFYNNSLPLSIIILSSFTLCTYFLVSIFSLLKTIKLDVTRQCLSQEKDYNSTLELLSDDIRTFRHDFGNIMQAIGGYIDTNDIDGLKTYYKQFQVDCEDIKSLEMLSPTIIENPAIYSILNAKYRKATNLGISIHIHISLKSDDLNIKIYEFTRILGVLLDNAIEACEKCNEKIINLEIRKDEKNSRQLLLIQNTYSNKNVDIDKIREKGYSSKTNCNKPHGLGLWEVDKILKKSNNLNLFTTKDSIFFTQQLEMY